MLETIRVGGTTYTSTEALQRFADCLSKPTVIPWVYEPPMTAARLKQIEAASKAAEAILARRDGNRGGRGTKRG